MNPLSIVLLIAFVILGVATSVAHREYERAFARRYRNIPPILAPWSRPDADPDVEWYRRRDFVLGIATIGDAIAVALSLSLNRPS